MFFPFLGGPIPNVPPPKPDPVVGDVWEFEDKSQKRVKITSSGPASGVTATDLDSNTSTRYWSNYELFKSTWKLVIPAEKTTAVVAPVKAKDYPHKCTRCGSAAYVGAAPMDYDCSNWACLSNKNKTIRITITV
jgi:hypothetical protein